MWVLAKGEAHPSELRLTPTVGRTLGQGARDETEPLGVPAQGVRVRAGVRARARARARVVLGRVFRFAFVFVFVFVFGLGLGLGLGLDAGARGLGWSTSERPLALLWVDLWPDLSLVSVEPGLGLRGWAR